MPFLSVIIPIYKVEEYLPKCIDSVINQDFTDLEIILVDDGSPDNCPAICDEYANKDSRIKVIHKKNGGLSEARNSGLKIATGKYVSFLDSDDAWEMGVLSKVVEKTRKNLEKVVVFQVANVYHNGTKEVIDEGYLVNQDEKTFSVLEFYKEGISKSDFIEQACRKLIDREFLINNDLYFKPNIISEDNEWWFRVLRAIDSIKIISDVLYLYTYGRPGSISNSKGKKSIDSLLQIIEGSQQFINSNEFSDILECEQSYSAYLLSITMGIYGGVDKNVKKQYKDRIKKLLFLLKKNNSKKVKLVRLVLTIFRFNLTCKILARYMNGKTNKKAEGK